jgi:hypothetical protein
MKKNRAAFPAWRSLVALLLVSGWAMAFAAPSPRLDDTAEGQKLARHLRTLAPSEPAEFQGALRISGSGSPPREVPITSKLTVGTNDWTSLYVAKADPGTEERLSIRRLTDQPNEYLWNRKGQVLNLKGNDATNRFSGSDFALMDLGMEFLHWPKQVLVTREMRKGRGCDVLESRPDRPGLYARVLSWIDQETSGLLMAEAYDASGKLLKEFEVKGFKKVAGQWRVREMEIRNRQTKTSTRLQFNFD